MRETIAAVAPAIAHALDPFIKIQLFTRQLLHVDAPQSHAVAVNARKIRFSTDPRRKSAIKRVIPDIQFPDARRIDGGNEIANAVGYINDIFVGANTIESRHIERRQTLGRNGQSPAAMGITNHPALLLAPFENRQIPAWPLF